MRRSKLMVLMATAALFGCAAAEDAPSDAAPGEMGGGEDDVALGPADGHDLPPTDLERVQAGDVAPDFTLISREGEPVTLSDYRGERNVILVFYRGQW